MEIPIGAAQHGTYKINELLDFIVHARHPSLDTLGTILQCQPPVHFATSNSPLPVTEFQYNDPYKGYRYLGRAGDSFTGPMNQIHPVHKSPECLELLQAQRYPADSEVYVMYVEEPVSH
jgi:hypothetical protein